MRSLTPEILKGQVIYPWGSITHYSLRSVLGFGKTVPWFCIAWAPDQNTEIKKRPSREPGKRRRRLFLAFQKHKRGSWRKPTLRQKRSPYSAPIQRDADEVTAPRTGVFLPLQKMHLPAPRKCCYKYPNWGPPWRMSSRWETQPLLLPTKRYFAITGFRKYFSS